MIWFPPGTVGAAGVDDAGVTLLDGWQVVSTVTTLPNSRAVSAGSNRLLLLSVNLRTTNSSEMTAVTFGGQSMVLVDGALVSAGPEQHSSLWRLSEAGIAAASGSAFGFTLSPAPVNQQFRTHSASYVNVNQTTPENDSFNATATGGANPTAVALTNEDGGLVVAVVGANRGTLTTGADEDAAYSNMSEVAEVQLQNMYMSIATAATDGTDFTPGITLTHESGAVFACGSFNPV
ncbi:hypothetical protein N9980_01925 [bacterium]|nr:hypothetical protein [bacterium]